MTATAAISTLSAGTSPSMVVMMALRLLYTAGVMSVVILLLRTGNPVGGLLLVPAAAVWLRREAESGRLAARLGRALRP